jgi:hypothetical protein
MDARVNKVMNVITKEVHVFENGYDLETNLISAIIYANLDSKRILDFDYRDMVTEQSKVEYITSKNGTKKVYSSVYDMISYTE